MFRCNEEKFSFMKNTTNLLLDILFPIKCISCDCEGSWICPGCLDKIPLRNNQLCPLCEKKITPAGRVCFSCRQKSDLDGLLVATSYKNTLVSSAVHCYKYRFAEKMHVPLGEILTRAYFHSDLPLPSLIIPVPLHPRRLRWRGFDQAGLLAKYLSESLTPGSSTPILEGFLLRKKYTRPQMQIKNYSQRQSNIKNAFVADASYDNSSMGRFLDNGILLLIDDIATTGSTLFECAKILKNSGAKKVFATVIARQELA